MKALNNSNCFKLTQSAQKMRLPKGFIIVPYKYTAWSFNMMMKQKGFFQFVSTRSKGFGLLEIVVAMGVLGVMTMGVVSVVDLVAKGGKTSSQTLQTAEMVNNLSMIMQSQAACDATFAGRTLPAASVEGAVLNSSNTIPLTNLSLTTTAGSTVNLIQTGVDYGGLIVDEILVQHLGAHSPFVDGGINVTKNFVKVHLKIRRTGTSALGVPEFTRAVSTSMIAREDNLGFVRCDPTGTGAPVGGGATPADEEAVCEGVMGGTYTETPPAGTPKCQIAKMSISANPADYGTTANFPSGANGVFIANALQTTGNIGTSGNITTSGNLSAASVSASSSLTTSQLIASMPLNTVLITASTVNVTGGFSAGNISTGGALSAASLTTSGAITSGAISATGNITATGSITATSDFRLKKNIRPIDNALDGVLNLRGVYYNWKDPNSDKKTQVGVIAQEVEKVFPQVVYNHPNGFKSVDYSHLVAVLIEALKEQQKQIDELKKNKNKDHAN